jgi:hypothetical protein
MFLEGRMASIIIIYMSGWMVWAHYCLQRRLRFVRKYRVFTNCLKPVKIPRVRGNARTVHVYSDVHLHTISSDRHSPTLSLMSACYNGHIGRESRKWEISYLMLPDVRYASRLATGRCCVKIIYLTVKLTENTRNVNPIYRNICPLPITLKGWGSFGSFVT